MTNEKLIALARTYGTPLYVFDADAFRKRARLVKDALGEKIRLCYSMKANPFLLRCLPAVRPPAYTKHWSGGQKADSLQSAERSSSCRKPMLPFPSE